MVLMQMQILQLVADRAVFNRFCKGNRDVRSGMPLVNLYSLSFDCLGLCGQSR